MRLYIKNYLQQLCAIKKMLIRLCVNVHDIYYFRDHIVECNSKTCKKEFY